MSSNPRRFTLVGERVKLGRDASNQLLMSVENRVLRGGRLAVGETVETFAVDDVRAVLQEAYELACVDPHAQSAVAGVADRLGLGLGDDSDERGSDGD